MRTNSGTEGHDTERKEFQTEVRFGRYDEIFTGCQHPMIFSPHILDAILTHTAGRVLDVGTGDGCKLRHVLDACPNDVSEVVALEPSPLYEQAEELFADRPKVTVLRSGLENFQSREDFDTILMFEVIEHIPMSLHDEVFERLVNLLTIDGTLVLSTPNRPVYRLKCRIAGEEPDPTHVAEYDFHGLEKRLTSYFQNIEWYGSLPWMNLIRKFTFLAKINSVLNPLYLSHALFAIARRGL